MNELKTIQFLKEIFAEDSGKDDVSLGVAIPNKTVVWLRNKLASTYNLMLKGSFGELVRLYSGSIEGMKSAEDEMISFVNKIDSSSLKEMAQSALVVLSKIGSLRDKVYEDISHFAMAKKVDELLKRVQDHLWKDTKRIFSCPELKGTPLYTWNAGPGANPVKPVRTFQKSQDKIQRERLLGNDPNEVFVDAFKKHQEKNKISTFEDYEKLIDGE